MFFFPLKRRIILTFASIDTHNHYCLLMGRRITYFLYSLIILTNYVDHSSTHRSWQSMVLMTPLMSLSWAHLWQSLTKIYVQKFVWQSKHAIMQLYLFQPINIKMVMSYSIHLTVDFYLYSLCLFCSFAVLWSSDTECMCYYYIVFPINSP